MADYWEEFVTGRPGVVLGVNAQGETTMLGHSASGNRVVTVLTPDEVDALIKMAQPIMEWTRSNSAIDRACTKLDEQDTAQQRDPYAEARDELGDAAYILLGRDAGERWIKDTAQAIVDRVLGIYK